MGVAGNPIGGICRIQEGLNRYLVLVCLEIRMKTGWIRCMLASMLSVVGVCGAAVTVENPNGGEAIAANSRWPIAWRCSSRTTQVTIEFSFTEGASWETVAPAAPAGAGKGVFLWTIPSISSPRCLIRVTDATNPGDSDVSDAAFTIFPCALRMDYDGDCLVTFADFMGFAQEWLQCGDPYDPACTGNRPPRIISTPPLQTAVGQSYTYNVKANDPDNDRLIYELSIAPAGMVIDPASGKITWSPTGDDRGDTIVAVQVRDQLGAADIQTFNLDAAVLFTGAPVKGFPNLFERRVLVYTNCVRMAPQQYRDKYMAGFQPNPSSIFRGYGAVEPLRYERPLNESARSHAQDMADHGCFQHDSCDGTPWSDRIERFYPDAFILGENVGAGYTIAKEMIDQLLCDAYGGQCAADRSTQAGHRTNMMDSRMRVIGTGYVYSASSAYRRYWVQDFAGNAPTDQAPIVAACHDFPAAGKTSFLLNYRDESNRPPASIQVFVNDVAYNMTLDLGTAAAGTYRLDLPTASGCRKYYFLAVTASGDVWRYPGPGAFSTSGEGPCSTDYQP